MPAPDAGRSSWGVVPMAPTSRPPLLLARRRLHRSKTRKPRREARSEEASSASDRAACAPTSRVATVSIPLPTHGKVGRMVPREQSGGAHDARSFRERLLIMAGEAGRTLGEEESSRMTAHYLLLRKWSRRMNLTGLEDERAILRRHFLEPIAAADLIGEEGDLLYLGSGNGFPAVPLAVLHPGVRLTLVEATEKRSAFLWVLLRELGLKGARVETRRVCRRADLADL